MKHWHREHFSTHQFYADVLFCFATDFPDEELDLLESGRDRHGYDCVLIRPGPSTPLTRYIQLKSTEADDTDLVGVHGQMLLSEYREIVQVRVRVSPQGYCEYFFLSDFGRLAYLALAISSKQLAEKSTARQSEVVKALAGLAPLIGGFRPPNSYQEIQAQWVNLAASKWNAWDGQLRRARKQLWADVLRPLAGSYKAVFENWRERHTLNGRWTRKVSRKDLIKYLYR